MVIMEITHSNIVRSGSVVYSILLRKLH